MGHKREEYDGEDRISVLPDELLVFILSGVTMKEAARTSVLSHRWQKLWTFHPCLELDGSKRLDSFLSQIRDIGPSITSKRRNEILDIERGGYVNWVNHILESSHLDVVDEFKVIFDLDERYKPDIDKWVRLAFEKKVKRFELDFSSYMDRVHNMDDRTFHFIRCNYPLALEVLPFPSPIFLTSLILKMVDLQKLALVLDKMEYFIFMRDIKWSENPILSQLKQLELHVVASDLQSLRLYAPLIKACTSLNRLALKLDWYGNHHRRGSLKLHLKSNSSIEPMWEIGIHLKSNSSIEPMWEIGIHGSPLHKGMTVTLWE
ncbi:hypothetical protein CCACVL1_13640 [Corchorus capsularis]|uniref:F-box domain-containing protein n=1 Tax=Corchorus capsularis TaxID=210143 RepID=A0A1R3IAC0_COCAP|nr:hypothetical protein CCACVL1_13640 [Corchorus capsularis]